MTALFREAILRKESCSRGIRLVDSRFRILLKTDVSRIVGLSAVEGFPGLSKVTLEGSPAGPLHYVVGSVNFIRDKIGWEAPA